VVVSGIEQLLGEAGLDAAAVEEVVHGTTVGSNALLQKAGAPTGLITTNGFRDVLEIGRLRTPGMFDLSWEKPEPLVRRRHRLEVVERIGADGGVVTALDEAGLIEAGRTLLAEGIESIAVCFINSYLNPSHERRAGTLLAEHFPDLAVSLSVDVLAEMREYERTSTVAVNAYVLPVLAAYLTRLEHDLAGIGIEAPLLVANSNGGLAAVATARDKPVFFISSGRSAGVVGAKHLGDAIGRANLIVFDMGGTTASAALVHQGELSRLQEYEFRAGISASSRFIKAGGYLMRVPTVDVAEVGSGAGSIAYVDAGGLLCVGPISAGADPGPACYGIGGDEPTVTDANLVLGYLPATLAGGGLVLDRGRAERAIETRIARPLGLGPNEAAAGIRDIVNHNMARVIRAVTVERGVDPRDFTLLAFGGSGPAHACDLARDIGIDEVVFPRMPGVFTAMGMLAGDIERYFIRTCLGLLKDLDVDHVGGLLSELREEATSALAGEASADQRVDLEFQIDLRFVGQDSQLPIVLPAVLSADTAAALRQAFLTAYRATYRYASSDEVEMVNLRVVARGTRSARLDFAELHAAVPSRPARSATRFVRFSGSAEAVEVPVLERQALAGEISGPAILESLDCTVVLPPGSRARLDAFANIIVTFR
jgi:N-methylhydantoinase A